MSRRRGGQATAKAGGSKRPPASSLRGSPRLKGQKTGEDGETLPKGGLKRPPASSLGGSPRPKSRKEEEVGLQDPEVDGNNEGDIRVSDGEKSPRGGKKRLAVADLPQVDPETKVPKKDEGPPQISDEADDGGEDGLSIGSEVDAGGEATSNSNDKSWISYEGLDPESRQSTLQVLAANPEPRFTLVQFGGGIGNQAGDAAVLTARNSRRLLQIDLGESSKQSTAREGFVKQRTTAQPKTDDASEIDSASEDEAEKSPHGKRKRKSDVIAPKKKPSLKKMVLITHSHADHESKDKAWRSLPKESTQIFMGGSAPTPVKVEAFKKSVKQDQEIIETPVTENGQRILGWKGKPTDSAQPPLRLIGRAILPPEETGPKQRNENEESLGVMITIDDKAADKRLLTFVSLGDMEGTDAGRRKDTQKQIQKLLTDHNHSQPADIVKLPHHGSPTTKNLGIIPDGLIGKKTTVISSGWTQGPVETFITKFKSLKPARLVFLFQEEKTAKANAGLAVMKKITQDLKAKGVEVIIARDMVLSAEDSGDIKVDFTGWK